MSKPCPDCGTTDESDFGIYGTHNGSMCRQTRCRKCTNHKSKLWREKNRRPSRLPAIYGITQAEYDVLLARQLGVCAICKGTNASGKALSVDHCHITHKIRGLLCSKCNCGLGQFNHDPGLLHAAADYLECYS